MKVFVIGVLVVFVGFWMVEAPNSLANFSEDTVSWVWDTATMVFEAVIDFLSAVFD